MRFARKIWLLGVLCGATASLPAQVIISVPSDIHLAGATLIDFESVANGVTSSLTLAGVTFSATPNFTVDTTYSGSFNTTGRYIQNNAGSVSQLNIDFSTPVSAFGFNFGAADVSWTLNAYDSGNNLLGSMTINPMFSSNAGEFFGLAVTSGAIKRVTVVENGSSDYILLDNFRFKTSAVPEPSVFLLMSLGALGLGVARWRRRTAA